MELEVVFMCLSVHEALCMGILVGEQTILTHHDVHLHGYLAQF